MPRALSLLILPLLFALAPACSSSKSKGGKEGTPKPGVGRLKATQPEEGRWKRLISQNDLRYLYSPEEKFDEDVVVLYVRSIPTPEGVEGEEALLDWLQGRKDASLIDAYIDDALGRPVVRIERKMLDAAGNTEDVRQALRLRERPPGDYWIRTKAIFFDDPEVPDQALEIGVSRNSFHGLVGDHYQRIARDFTEKLLLENKLAGFDPDLLEVR